MRFDIGEILLSHQVAIEYQRCQEFSLFVDDCLRRHEKGDWGDIDEDDKKANSDAATNGNDRILSSYRLPEESWATGGVYFFGESSLWIITEWDRSVTTILFPSEY